MRFILILILGASFFLTSCKKGKADITLKGQVTDATFNTSLTNGTIEVYELIAATGDYNLLGSQVIGTDGSYSFTFPRNAAESYLIEIRKADYFHEDVVIPLSSLTIEEDNVRNFSTTVKSWAALRFITTNPNAALTYTRQSGKTGCSDCCTAEPQTYYGLLDTIIYCPNDGNTTYAYNYTASGVFGIKEIVTAAYDTTTITLSY